MVVARGTSDNAARYAQYALGMRANLPVALAAPSLVTLYKSSPLTRGALVVGVSQSGRSPDVVETLAEARRRGALTVAVVNDASSPLARAAAEVIPIHAGEERSVAATKTYTAQLTALALLTTALARSRAGLAALRRVPGAVARALETRDPAERQARHLARARHCAVLARGIHHATAHEIALKLKELAGLAAEAYSSADFQHGPIALARAGGLTALVVNPPGGAAARELALLTRKLRAQGARVLTLGPRAAGSLPAPRLDEWLSPIAAVVPGQWLVVETAVARGLDPGRPKGLVKITETR
jgi:glucosamine--fructose-6-phosphate aminotransferase (isomerizing)